MRQLLTKTRKGLKHIFFIPWIVEEQIYVDLGLHYRILPCFLMVSCILMARI